MSLTSILILSNLTTLVLTILSIIYTRRLLRMRSIQWMIALSVTFLIGSFCLVNIFIAQDFSEKILFLHLRVFGMAFLAPCTLYFFSSVFQVWNWLHKSWVKTIIFAPSVFNIILLINPSTRVKLYTNFRPTSFMDVTTVKFDFGSWYAPFYLWAMVIMVSCMVISISAFMKSSGYRRRQVLILNIGMTLSLLQSVAARIFPGALEIEYILSETTILLGTAIGITYAVIYHRLLSIVPLALERIFKQFPDPVFVLDDENKVMGVSESGIKFFGIGAHYLGKNFGELLPSVKLEPGEVILEGPARDLHHFNIAVEKIGENNETASGTVVFFRDIGPQKLVELRLHEGMEFRTRLLTLMAHDLSGFVGTQAMIAQVLQKKIGTEHSQNFDHLEALSLASESLISNVMSWTQNESLKFDLVKKSFEWNTLIRSTLEQVGARLIMKEIEVDFDPSPIPILSIGDSEMMSSVLRNIIFNSVRASENQKKIFVSLSQSKDSVVVKVRDQGTGIAPEELKRILEASKVFTTTGISKTHGSGVGLMLVRSFISLHKGTFAMESDLGIGTQIIFSIPK